MKDKQEHKDKENQPAAHKEKTGPKEKVKNRQASTKSFPCQLTACPAPDNPQGGGNSAGGQKTPLLKPSHQTQAEQGKEKRGGSAPQAKAPKDTTRYTPTGLDPQSVESKSNKSQGSGTEGHQRFPGIDSDAIVYATDNEDYEVVRSWANIPPQTLQHALSTSRYTPYIPKEFPIFSMKEGAYTMVSRHMGKILLKHGQCLLAQFILNDLRGLRKRPGITAHHARSFFYCKYAIRSRDMHRVTHFSSTWEALTYEVPPKSYGRDKEKAKAENAAPACGDQQY